MKIKQLMNLNKEILQDPEINNLNQLKQKILETHTTKYLVNPETNTATEIINDDVESKLSKIDLAIKERIEIIQIQHNKNPPIII